MLGTFFKVQILLFVALVWQKNNKICIHINWTGVGEESEWLEQEANKQLCFLVPSETVDSVSTDIQEWKQHILTGFPY